MTDLSLTADRFSFSLGLNEPLSTSHGEVGSRKGFLVAVSDGKRTGYGEATPLRPWTEPYGECEVALREYLERLEDEGTVPADETDAPAARYAVSVAVADLRAKRRGVPLYAHLGGGGLEEAKVGVNATVGDAGIEETLAEAERCVKGGYGTVKLKVGARGVEEDIERVLGVDEAFGVCVRADANGSWGYDEASRFADAVAGLGSFEYLEQPLDPGNLEAHARLRHSSGIDVALDEGLLCHSIKEVVEENAADHAVLKPMSTGGIREARRICVEAQESGVVPVVSNLIESVVGRTAAAHVAASVPVETACGLGTGGLLREEMGDGVVRNGEISISEKPGNAETEVGMDTDRGK